MIRAWLRVAFLLLLALGLGAGCGDGYFAPGCKKYCKCHRGKTSKESCEKRCVARLERLKKKDRVKAQQIAECMGMKGKRTCAELAACSANLPR